MPFVLPPLYPILDAHCFPADLAARQPFLEKTVRDLAAHGVTLLQLRMKQASRDELLQAADIVRAAAPPGLRLILNDHPELVRETGFDGVHLGQGDMPLAEARAILGPEALLGISTHRPKHLAQESIAEADYIATGPVFATASKLDAEPVIGLAGVRTARTFTGKPLVAIGGITREHAQAVWAAGADSIAVIGALFVGAATPGRLAGDFLRLFP